MLHIYLEFEDALLCLVIFLSKNENSEFVAILNVIQISNNFLLKRTPRNIFQVRIFIK